MTPKSSLRGVPTGASKHSVLMPSAPEHVVLLPAGSSAQTDAIVEFRPKPRGSHGEGVADVPQFAGATGAPLQSLTVAGFTLYSTPPNVRMPSFILQEGTRR